MHQNIKADKPKKRVHGQQASMLIMWSMPELPNLSLEEGLDILRKCVHEIQTRFLMNTPKFTIKVIDKYGVRLITL